MYTLFSIFMTTLDIIFDSMFECDVLDPAGCQWPKLDSHVRIVARPTEGYIIVTCEAGYTPTQMQQSHVTMILSGVDRSLNVTLFDANLPVK
jgi:hypothetical protein